MIVFYEEKREWVVNGHDIVNNNGRTSIKLFNYKLGLYCIYCILNGLEL